MARTIIYNDNDMSKTIVQNNATIKIMVKPFFGKETVFYNNSLIPSAVSFGGATNTFVAIEQEKPVQYVVLFSLRWHCMGFYTTVKRQKEIIYSDRPNKYNRSIGIKVSIPNQTVHLKLIYTKLAGLISLISLNQN